ncbi:hypothetical protein ASD8599_03386 [Ascidiaceihabitans donghaensis]|uniref:Uncharacterized protein n=1 Tax=Ascidiaceihabitans donghaensis TaxID=1510460 RepID=A0A2R8BHP8_9RHOB|nr:hypothetical protein [Ascidiaceihabitans donghaensis]SPH22644.1 hypothetical protein ASD8599_03386 [Ascidiaceihabitans donghaensis]
MGHTFFCALGVCAKLGGGTPIFNVILNKLYQCQAMLRVFSLLLPCLIPSWRFFQAIEPSPRVEWRIVRDLPAPTSSWVPYNPRPQTTSVFTMLRRLFWNPAWNDDLFMVSLSERLTLAPSTHSIDEIRARITQQARRGAPSLSPTSQLQFRLVFISRGDASAIVTETTYVSAPFAAVAA